MKIHSVFFFFLIFYTSTWQSVVANHFRYDYRYSQEADGWIKFHEVPATFTDAMLRCKEEGALLASPLNEGFRQAMTSLFKSKSNNYGVFTGIHATYSPGDFSSVEGIPLPRMQVVWAPGEPGNNEKCTILLPNGNLAGVTCGGTRPYMCYRKRTNTTKQSKCGTVDKEYFFEARTGSCYKFHKIGKDWRGAYRTCVAEGAHLVIINNEVEAQVMKKLYAKYPPHAITAEYVNYASAGYYTPAENHWLTIQGETLPEAGYATFDRGQPNGQNKEFCGAISRDVPLHDVWCDAATMPFICEMKPDSLMN